MSNTKTKPVSNVSLSLGKSPNTGIIKPTPKNEDPDLSQYSKEVLEKQLQVIAAAEAAQRELQLKAEELEKQQRHKQYQDLLSLAEQLEKMSIEATQPFDKNHYAREAADVRNRIKSQFAEFLPAQSIQENPTTFSDRKSAIIQFASLTSLLILFMAGFQLIRNYILAYNEKILRSTSEFNTATLMSSYGPDSFQKLFFEGIATCVDLFSLLGILFVISPTAFKYIIPFFTSKHDPSADFNSLSPWQRQLKSYLLLASVLLYLGLRHAVKP